MILQALNQYYQRLADDPEQDVPTFGFSLQKISFCTVIEPDGSLVAFQPVVSEVVKGRPLPQSLIVPGQGKPSGSGINPCLLWDNATYMLGLVPEGRNTEWAQQRFEAFRQRHLEADEQIDNPAFSAACRFLEQWQPEQVEAHPELAEMTGNFGAFRLRAETGYIHDLPAVQTWWTQQIENMDHKVTGRCLVTNRSLPLARLHEPKIKGVRDAQSSGALMVTFNLDAFGSYGKDQGYNAPVSTQAAFQYTTALNRLLNDKTRRIQIGDATTVFWTDKPSPQEQVIPSLFSGAALTRDEGEDNDLLTRVRSFLARLRQGKPDDLASDLGDPDTRYYILGLSPNASRISVRFWLTATLGELADRLARHVRDLEITGLDDRPPIIRELLRETAPAKKGWPDEDSIPKPLTTGLIHAVLKGQPYPMAFYTALLRRIRSEQFINPNKRKDWRRGMVIRAAAIKAILIRNFKKEITVSLDPNHPEPAYHLGRWFAVLEKTQRDALGEKLNATIKDRYYSAASATPVTVLPRLIQLSQHHLRKIKNTGLRITREKQVQEIASHMKEFPRRLSLEQQGLFHLGYYHQNSDLYTSKKNNNENLENN